MNKSFACQKRGVRRNRYGRFSIPKRSERLRFFFRSFSFHWGGFQMSSGLSSEAPFSPFFSSYYVQLIAKLLYPRKNGFSR